MTADHPFNQTMGRRRCLRTISLLGAGLLAGLSFSQKAEATMNAPHTTKVVIVKTADRVKGIQEAMNRFDLSEFRGATVAVKANYNSADPFPASTHPDTLRTFMQAIKNAGAGPLTLAERSGMGNTPDVLETMGALQIAEDLDVNVVVMDDLGKDDYVAYEPKESHWKRGFCLARPFVEANKVVQTCCLKTHQYGGNFTLSLKNAVGAVAKYDPADNYNYMSELHSSSDQRQLVAEISIVYRNDLILMDGMKAFVTGGPHSGKEVEPGVIVAGTDPVAVDAVGVAILRMFGTTSEVSSGAIFDQEQIKRAAELGIGVASPNEIELIPVGDGAEAFVKEVREQLG
ncbi:MAG: DUF362 domain-containing protein [Pseudodesulfovibrio sp.]